MITFKYFSLHMGRLKPASDLSECWTAEPSRGDRGTTAFMGSSCASRGVGSFPLGLQSFPGLTERPQPRSLVWARFSRDTNWYQLFRAQVKCSTLCHLRFRRHCLFYLLVFIRLSTVGQPVEAAISLPSSLSLPQIPSFLPQSPTEASEGCGTGAPHLHAGGKKPQKFWCCKRGGDNAIDCNAKQMRSTKNLLRL